MFWRRLPTVALQIAHKCKILSSNLYVQSEGDYGEFGVSPQGLSACHGKAQLRAHRTTQDMAGHGETDHPSKVQNDLSKAAWETRWRCRFVASFEALSGVRASKIFQPTSRKNIGIGYICGIGYAATLPRGHLPRAKETRRI